MKLVYLCSATLALIIFTAGILAVESSVKVSNNGSVVVEFKDSESKKILGSLYDQGKVFVRNGEVHNGVTVVITETATSWTIDTEFAWLRPFMVVDRDDVEEWFLEFNVTARNIADSTAIQEYTITGVDFLTGSNEVFQALACMQVRSGGGARECGAYVIGSDDVIHSVSVAASGHNRNAISGTVRLESKPTWVP